MSEFAGFPKEFMSFFEELQDNNNKQWFNANRKRYDEFVVETSRAFVPAFGERLQVFIPNVQYEAKANKSLGRINRDVRFSKDKSPYNLQMTYRFWEGEGKVSANPHFTIWVGPNGIGAGAGVRRFSDEGLADFREILANDTNGDFAKMIGELEQMNYDFIGEKYKKVPAGFSEDSPNAKWLKFIGMACYTKQETPQEVNSLQILDNLAEICETMSPLHNWIAEWYCN